MVKCLPTKGETRVQSLGQEDLLEKGMATHSSILAPPPKKGAQRNILASLVAQMVKCLPTTQETQFRSLGQEDPLEKDMATHSSTLAWKIPWMENPMDGKSHGRRILVGYSPWGRKESDTTE